MFRRIKSLKPETTDACKNRQRTPEDVILTYATIAKLHITPKVGVQYWCFFL
jgi:hypothetical protein